MTKVGVFSLQLFLLIGYTYFINFIVLASEFFLYSQQVLADSVVNYYHKLRVSNHRLTILLGSLFLSHTYVNEDAIFFEKKQQEQNNASHATITRPCQERGRGGPVSLLCQCFTLL